MRRILFQIGAPGKILNASISSKYTSDDNVSYILGELFLEQWIVKINYEHYFTQCASNICTYSYKKRADFIYMIAFILGVYGGLQTALRMLIPSLIKFMMKKKRSNLMSDPSAVQTANLDRRGIVHLFLDFHFSSPICWQLSFECSREHLLS